MEVIKLTGLRTFFTIHVHTFARPFANILSRQYQNTLAEFRIDLSCTSFPEGGMEYNKTKRKMKLPGLQVSRTPMSPELVSLGVSTWEWYTQVRHSGSSDVGDAVSVTSHS